MSKIQEWVLNSEAETIQWASEYAKSFEVGDAVALMGTLGAGKTFMVSAFCKALGYKGAVHSPSYALVNEYEHAPPLIHMDLYRLPDGADLEEIGVEYYRFSESICFVEWPERLGALNLRFNKVIQIDVLSENSRKVVVSLND
jgi:tRNA threonylcarbamoyladenosine biosynthesis protein TsaE